MNNRSLIILMLFLWSFLTLTPTVQAQEESGEATEAAAQPEGKATLTISGTLYEDGLRLYGVNLVVKDNGKVISESQSDDNGKFEIELKLDKQFMLYFEKDEFATKIVEIDTRNVPADNRKFKFYYKGWKVDMIPTDLGVDVSVLKKPVALVIYNPAEDGFSTDKKYERSVRPALTKLADNVYNAYDEKFMSNEDAYDDYMLAVKDGDLFLKEGDYDNALMQYEAAKELMPKESYPDKQIAKTYALLEANKSEDEQYASFIEKADGNFEGKNWAIARENYELAHDVKPDIDYPKDQIDKIIVSIAAEKELAKLNAAKAKEAAYKAQIASADSLLNKSMYAESKLKYQAAIEIDGQEYPKSKIKEIDGILAGQLAADKTYTKLMADANVLMNTKKFNEAKEKYSEAQAIKPEEKLPATKIAEADAFLAAILAASAKDAELAKLKEQETQAQYDALIISADALLVDTSYNEAKADYEKALVLIPKQEYPEAQIALVDKKILEIQSIDRQYEKLMSDGVKYNGSGELERAKTTYEEASTLKPNAQAPKDAIASIDAKLASAALLLASKQKAIDDKYNGFIANGDANIALEKFDEAKAAYKSALMVKSKEEYPKSQIVVIDAKLAVISAAALAADNEEKALAVKENNYNALIAKADQLFKGGSLDASKEQYNEALQIFPNKTYPASQITEIDSQLAVLVAAAEAKATAEIALKEKEGRYNAFVAEADAFMLKNDYPNARIKYEAAQQAYAEKTYPTNQLAKIDDFILAEKKKAAQEALLAKQQVENKVAFDKVVAEGDALVANNDLEKAKYKYEAALKLIPGDDGAIQKMRDLSTKMEEARKLAEFHAKNDTEFNKQLAEKYPNGLNETKKEGSKTVTRIIVVANNRGDEFKKEVYSYGAIFYFKNGKKIDESSYKRETKGH